MKEGGSSDEEWERPAEDEEDVKEQNTEVQQ